MAGTEGQPVDPAVGERSEADPATTLESFVSRLHADGVEAGRKEAERLIEDAKGQASAITSTAEADARSLVESAEAKAKREWERVEAELRLAVRDALLELQSTLSHALTAVLRRAATKELNNPALVADLLREVVGAYARADAEGGTGIEVRVSRKLSDELADWGVNELSRSLKGGGDVDLQTTLAEAGFEYRINGSTVEVTPDAAVDKLKELVTPRLRELLSGAAKEMAAGSARGDGRADAASGHE